MNKELTNEEWVQKDASDNYKACVAVATNSVNKYQEEDVQRCGDGLLDFNCIGCPFKPQIDSKKSECKSKKG